MAVYKKNLDKNLEFFSIINHILEIMGFVNDMIS